MTVRIQGYGRRRRIVFSRARRIRRYWGRGPVVVIAAVAVPIVAWSIVQAVRAEPVTHRPAPAVHVSHRPAEHCGPVRVRTSHGIVRKPLCVPLRLAKSRHGSRLLRAVIAYRMFRSLRHLVPYRWRHPYRYGRRYRPFTVRWNNAGNGE